MRFFVLRYKTLLLACFLLLVSIMNMSSEIPTDNLSLRSYFFEIVFNIEKILVNIHTSITDVFVNSKNIKQLEQELINAEQEILYYKELSRLYTNLKQENDQLKNILNIRKNIQYSAYYSKVIFRDPSLLSDYLMIDKGSNDGLKINMPVVYSVPNSEDLVLVGKIAEISSDFSRVQLITAKNFYIGVKTKYTGYHGILKGQGSWNQNLSLEYIPVEANPNLDDPIVTSGGSSIYPEGISIGSITGIKQNVMEEFFQTLYIKSKFEYSKITDVFVLDYKNEYPNFEVGEGIEDGF